MENKYKYNVKWDKGHEKATDHKLNIDLDLALSNFIGSKNVAAELVRNEGKIRREIFELIVENLVPTIVSGTGHDGSMPMGELRTKSKSNHESEWKIEEPKIEGESIVFRNRMKIVMNIQTDRPVDAIQALQNSDHGLANIVTNDVIFSLKQRYLGVVHDKTHTKSQDRNDMVTGYDANSTADYLAA